MKKIKICDGVLFVLNRQDEVIGAIQRAGAETWSYEPLQGDGVAYVPLQDAMRYALGF